MCKYVTLTKQLLSLKIQFGNSNGDVGLYGATSPSLGQLWVLQPRELYKIDFKFSLIT